MFNAIKAFGIDIEHSWTSLFFKVVYFVIESMSIGIVSYSFYHEPTYQVNLTNVAIIALCITTRQIVSNNMAKLIDVVQQLNACLDSDKLQRVKITDSVLSISTGISYCLLLIGGSVATLGYDSIAGIEVGFNIRPVCCSALIEMTVLIGYLYHFYMLAAFICLYSLVQYVLVKHAQACQLLFASHLQPRLNETEIISYLVNCQNAYRRHLDAKRQVNQLIGFIPFALFSLSFIFVVVTITYLIVNEESIPKSFLLLIVVPGALTNIALTVLIVRVACKATEEFEHARLVAGNIAIDSVTCNSQQESLQQQSKSLYMLISVEKPVYATAWGLFDINRQLGLHFINAVIPFAVMIITASMNKSKH